MPHSVCPEDSASPDHDAIVQEPNTDNVKREGTVVANTIGPIGESQTSDDRDMTMAVAGLEQENPPVKTEITSEVKLEDLFADMDSDEEFSTSTGQDVKISSSPEAPASLV
jgi:DNA primase small subunit